MYSILFKPNCGVGRRLYEIIRGHKLKACDGTLIEILAFEGAVQVNLKFLCGEDKISAGDVLMYIKGHPMVCSWCTL